MNEDNPPTPDHSAQAGLAEVAAIAAGRGWTSVTRFAAAVPAGDARDVAILAANEVDAGPLADWTRKSAATVTVAPLAALAAEAGPVLAPNRILVALRCGLLLTGDDVTVATSVMVRPAGTYRIVLTGAEDITSADDLALVERGVWRTLLAPDGEAWQGQDIAARGCLLWTGQDIAGVARERIAADDAALRDWLAGPVSVPAELARARTDYAATLALEALDAGTDPAGPAGSVRGEAPAVAGGRALQLADLTAEVRGLHERLLSRLDADATTTERRVLASLQTLKQDLVSPVAGRTAGYAEHSIRQWAAETDRVIAQQAASTRDDARHLLSRADWDLVNEITASAGGGYPAAILGPLDLDGSGLPAGALVTGPGLTSGAVKADGDRLSALRPVSGGVLVTAGIGAVALGLLGLPLLPVAGATALGIIGGSIYAARHQAQQDRQRERQMAGAAAGSSVAQATPAITAALREQAAARRAAVGQRFAELIRALDERAAAEQAGSGRPPADSTFATGRESLAGDDQENVRTRLRTLIRQAQL